MFNSTLMDFDLGLLGESPFAELGSLSSEHVADDKTLQQHLVEEAEEKRMVEDNTNWLEATSDLQSFIDIGSLPEVETKEDIDCQSVINDVDKLLSQIEAPQQPFKELPDDVPIEAFPEAEMAAAENILDELLKANGIPQLDLLECQEQQEEEQPKALAEPKIEVEDLDDSGFVDMTNVSKIITEDGQEVLIIIAPPSPASTCTTVVAPESVAMIDSSGDDSEWTPDSPKSSKGRPMVQRSTKRTNRKAAPYIKDKKERKKQQNVEAARRYRDKKKMEQSEVETEEQALCAKNKKLKSQVQELEAEVKTMKKLMLELNILKA